MFGLMDSLDDEKWEEKEVATKTGKCNLTPHLVAAEVPLILV